MRLLKLIPLLLAALPLIVSAKDECKGKSTRCIGNTLQFCNIGKIPNQWDGSIVCQDHEECVVLDKEAGIQFTGCRCKVTGMIIDHYTPCVPKSRRCDDQNNLQMCEDNGDWKTIMECKKPDLCKIDERMKDGSGCIDLTLPPAECVTSSATSVTPSATSVPAAAVRRQTFGNAAPVNETADLLACGPFIKRSCGPDNTVYNCNPEQKKWVALLKCPEGTRCDIYAPGDPCVPVPVNEVCLSNSTRCYDGVKQECTDAYTWKNMDDSDQCRNDMICHEDCGHESCLLTCIDPEGENAKLAQCVPGRRQCGSNGSRLLLCAESSKTWQTEEMCPNAGDCKADAPGKAHCERAPPSPVESTTPTLLESSDTSSSLPTTFLYSSVASSSEPATTTMSSSVASSSSSLSSSTSVDGEETEPETSTSSSEPSNFFNTWTASTIFMLTNPWAVPVVTESRSSSSSMPTPSSSITGTSTVLSSLPSTTPATSVTETPRPSPPPCVCSSIDTDLATPGPPPPPCTCLQTPSPSPTRRVVGDFARIKPRMESCNRPGNDRCLHNKSDKIQECVSVNEVSEWYDVTNCPLNTECREDTDMATGTVVASCGHSSASNAVRSVDESCDRPGIDRCVGGQIQECVTINDVSSWHNVTACPKDITCLANTDEASGSVIARCNLAPKAEACTTGERTCSWDSYTLQLCNDEHVFEAEKKCTYPGDCKIDGPGLAHCERGGISPPGNNPSPIHAPPTRQSGIPYGDCTADQKYDQKCVVGPDNRTRSVFCGQAKDGRPEFKWFQLQICEDKTPICEFDHGYAHCTRNLTLPNNPAGCEKWDKICSWEHDKLLTCNVTTQKYDVELICTEGGICVEDSPRRARCDRGGVHPPPIRRQQLSYGNCTKEQHYLEDCHTDANGVPWVLACLEVSDSPADGYKWFEKHACNGTTPICEVENSVAHCSKDLTNDPAGCEKWDKICSWEHDKLLACNVETQKYDVELICTEGDICVMDRPRRSRCARGGVHPPPTDLDTPREPGKCKVFDKKCADDNKSVLACNPTNQTWYTELLCKNVFSHPGVENSCESPSEFIAYCNDGGLPPVKATPRPKPTPKPTALASKRAPANECNAGDKVCDSKRRFLFYCIDGKWTTTPSQCFGSGFCRKNQSGILTCDGFPLYGGHEEFCAPRCESMDYLYCIGTHWNDDKWVQKCKTNMCAQADCKECDRCHYSIPSGVTITPDMSTFEPGKRVVN
ncbi:hypothetical protein CC86DRAFT_432621 [Ophiobolus disseminans]|uniref:Uncharacterized protein n=1 Tax=Ophiobolus disseminans TaxID=1469910 RepID=A0A6A6ZF23_9PLEO|nr:hypothetical protein CC86DRAFT_432621 [Ophiobolus disseminans]